MLGILGAFFCLATVLATAIYVQLKTVPRWNHMGNLVMFLLPLTGGAITDLIGLCISSSQLHYYRLAYGSMAMVVLQPLLNNRSATQLGSLGQVRLFEAAFWVKLPVERDGTYYWAQTCCEVTLHRVTADECCARLLAMMMPLSVVVFIAGIHIAGVMASRWLFAEAEHVVGLYYDKR